MHHKRRRPKSSRAGCLFCKPYKRQGSKRAARSKFSQRRKALVAKEKILEFQP